MNPYPPASEIREIGLVPRLALPVDRCWPQIGVAPWIVADTAGFTPAVGPDKEPAGVNRWNPGTASVISGRGFGVAVGSC